MENIVIEMMKMRTNEFMDEINLMFEENKMYDRNQILEIILTAIANNSDSDIVKNHAMEIANMYKLSLNKKYEKEINKISIKKVVMFLNKNLLRDDDFVEELPSNNGIKLIFHLINNNLIYNIVSKVFSYE